jgi:beta-glucosidase
MSSLVLSPESQAVPDGRHRRVDDLLARMTLDEKIGQLNLLTPGDEVLTGPTVNTDIERKVRAGEVGGLFGITDRKKSVTIRKQP